MEHARYLFSTSSTDFYFAGGFSYLKKIAHPQSAILITDANVFAAHSKRFANWRTIILKPGEQFKIQQTVDEVINQLIGLEADRGTTLVGIGGGVITDITGYVASVYMRGLRFGFIPTSLLGLVDASIGGKNGIDVGLYKNMVGTIRQPSFILHDMAFLNSLPEAEWINGFAEIIKHACIKDAAMFTQIEGKRLADYRRRQTDICALVQRNAALKARVVKRDEFEKNERRLLNFGHTLGHALEKDHQLMHGEAVAIGMTYAARISERLNGFRGTERLVRTLEQYGLPTQLDFDKKRAFALMKMDKKREKKEINYVLLEKIGKGIIKPIPVKQLEKIISNL